MDRIWTNLNGLTQSAIVVITLIAIVFHVQWTRRNTALGPTFLTTLGIFFRFTGIAWGLLNFDASDVRYSIPRLLEGIRTSFWASVAGIFWALTIKARLAIWGDAKLAVTANNQQGATLNDVAEYLARLNSALAGKEDSTLLGQIKLLRSDSNYRLDRLNATFESYSENIAAANSRALVQALQTVVRDFNAQVNDQFGAQAEAILKAYPHGTDAEAVRAARHLRNDTSFAWNMWTWAREQSKEGKGKVFSYYYNNHGPQAEGSGHGSDVPFAFQTVAQNR